MVDNSEVKLGTNPKNPDSDGDGVSDSLETYYNQKVIGDTATVLIDGVGDVGKNIMLAKDSSAVLVSSLPDVVNTVDISSSRRLNHSG